MISPSVLLGGILLFSSLASTHPRSFHHGHRELNQHGEVEPICRAPTSPFDYSAKFRSHEALPVCLVSEVPDPSELTALASESTSKLLVPRQSALVPDDYTCGPGRPCRNRACCPRETGQCNYGPKACGTTGTSPNDVCLSNCDAKAECGRYADPPGKKCPLNVCCSQWGFCGSQGDFCKVTNDTETSCQSNCDQPGPKNKSDGNVQSRVIGYYEAWNYKKACQGMGFGDIPVGALTHAYFSFGYITPGDFRVAPMDDLPTSLFSDFNNIKKRNIGLKTVVALGGWTFNDNGTVTQPVFSNMVSTAANRLTFINNLFGFMRKYGFDGVDFDWEYPGAGDRGGKPDDGKNFVQFLKELDDINKDQPRKFIVSFTIPTSYWYLRHFDLKAIDYVDFVNIMSYDLHGVWDSNNPIGSKIYGHSNITEIDQALNLLWRNDVPANKLNLGLGFYGRSFTLTHPECTTPGCGFRDGGIKGPCSGEPGILSYREIKAIIKEHNLKPHYDKEAGVKYITWNSDQWVSYDDAETFKQKIDFANDRGLAGLLIWAIDQDTEDLEALNAVVAPQSIKALALKAEKASFWEDATMPDCYVTSCGGTCKAGFIRITNQPCGGAIKVTRHSTGADSLLCCPLDAAPRKEDCTWRGGAPNCNGRCHDNEVAVQMNRWGDGKYCEDGNKMYCCESPVAKTHDCYWQRMGKRTCNGDDQAMTFSGTFISFVGDFGKAFADLTGNRLVGALGDLANDAMKLYCCPKDQAKEWENCKWYGKPGSCFDNHCPIGHSVQLTDSPYGLGSDCFPRIERVRVFCCDPAHGKSPFLPVALEKLFPNPPKGDKVEVDHELLTDDTWGTGNSKNGNDDDANDASFSFVVLTSPEELQVSLSKRDGSHWDVFGCDPNADHEEEHTVQMVCTDVSENSNCGKISLGHGVPGTILQMPKGCGPGKYAVAKHMKPAKGQILPRHLDYLTHKPVVYDLTFDYDFARVPRDLGKTQMRVDFSNQQGYWDNIVAADIKRKRDLGLKHKRELDHVGGNHLRWLEEEYRDDFHFGGLTPDELNKRWFGSTVVDWLRKMIKPEIKKTFTHDIDQEVTAKIVDETWDCPGRDGRILAQAKANIKVSTSFGFTLIATSLFPLDIRDSYLTFGNKGEIKCTFTMEALARFTYDTGEKPIIDIPFPGAALRIPGIATVGPALAVKGRIEAGLALAAELEAKLDVVSWEYEYRLPATADLPPTNPDEAEYGKTGDKNGIMAPTFYAGVMATGNAKAHLIASLQFGIAFDDRWKMGKAGAEVTADSWVEVTAKAGISTQATCPFTWGLQAGVDLYAQASGFKWATNKYTLPGTAKFNIYESGQCPDLKSGNPQRRREIEGARVGMMEAMSSSPLAKRLTIGPFIHIPIEKLICPSLPPTALKTSKCEDIVGWEEHQLESALKRRSNGSYHLLERRRDVKACSKGSLPLKAPTYRSSGALPGQLPGVATFDYLSRPIECNNFDFGVTAAPRASTVYATEHIIELQMVALFIDAMNDKWGMDFIDYTPAGDGITKNSDFCGALKSLWRTVKAADRFAMDGVKRDPLEHLMHAFPGNHLHTAEFVLLEKGVNLAKAGMWGDDPINNDGTAETYLANTPDDLIKNVKDVMTAMKYMQNADVSKVLVTQKDRIKQRLKDLDEVEMPKFQKHTRDRGQDVEKDWHRWTERGLADEWDTWMKTRATRAKDRAVDYIDTWLGKLKKKAEDEWHPQQGALEERILKGETLSADEMALGQRLTDLIGKVVALNAEWERYEPNSWMNPF
ncbi:putative glycosyl hydrolases family 18 protein [Cercophora samala]|uniref:chitinase n=1 Tax=Cercophora samala TaxID=330535 RepID=A0AA39ZG41_9PEZI|nr:putative glycosyl hydrolases family 18 protein [Cercophora samala]